MKMLTKLLLCCGLLFMGLSTSAQTRIVDIDHDREGPIASAPGSIIGQVRTPIVRAANLPQNPLGYFVLPSGAEAMFIKFELLNYSTSIPVEIFEYETTINGHPVYKMISTEFDVDFTELCQNSEGLTSFIATYTLVTASGEDYPIHDFYYSNPNGIFTCEVFDLTCNDCNSNRGCPMVTEDHAYVVERSKFKCPSREGIIISTTTREAPDETLNEAPGAAVITAASIQPNPFKGQLQLDYQLEKEEMVKITIFSAQGQMMMQNSKQQVAERYQNTYDTSDWPSGIYFCQIQTAHHTQLLKVVKAN